VPFFTRHLLPLLQLTRMALVFTAIADALTSVLLLTAARTEHGDALAGARDWRHALAMAACSVGLYGFGMSLNDIIDHRRDQLLSPNRPLPSGRVGLRTAHFICGALALLALAGGFIYGQLTEDKVTLMLTTALVVGVLLLIVFYDYAGKYLVWAGLLTLGLIRFFHATIPAPQVPVLWHPLWLFNHVAVLSTVCYVLEEKRPALTRAHILKVVAGIVAVNCAWVGIVWYRRLDSDSLMHALSISPGLLLPMLGTAGFLGVATLLLYRIKQRRDAGQALMLYGLLWLIVYDAAFVAGYVGWRESLMVMSLLPLAYLSVQLMRAWSRMLALSQKPQFKRAS